MTMSVNELFAQELEVDLAVATDDLEYNTIQEWDSVAHMRVIAALEEAFDILLDAEDIIDMSSIGKAKEILGKYGVGI